MNTWHAHGPRSLLLQDESNYLSWFLHLLQHGAVDADDIDHAVDACDPPRNFVDQPFDQHHSNFVLLTVHSDHVSLSCRQIDTDGGLPADQAGQLARNGTAVVSDNHPSKLYWLVGPLSRSLHLGFEENFFHTQYPSQGFPLSLLGEWFRQAVDTSDKLNFFHSYYVALSNSFLVQALETDKPEHCGMDAEDIVQTLAREVDNVLRRLNLHEDSVGATLLPQVESGMVSWSRQAHLLLQEFVVNLQQLLDHPEICARQCKGAVSGTLRCGSQLVWIGYKFFELKMHVATLLTLAAWARIVSNIPPHVSDQFHINSVDDGELDFFFCDTHCNRVSLRKFIFINCASIRKSIYIGGLHTVNARHLLLF